MEHCVLFTHWRKRRWTAGLAGLTAAAGLSACVSGVSGMPEGIGYREARFQEISAMREYRACVQEGVAQTGQAKSQGNVAGYLTAAGLLEQCEANLGPEVKQVALEERMRAYAVSVLSYVKAGDLARARTNLIKFKSAFPEHDLYLPNGGSFVDTITILTNGMGAPDANENIFLNVNRDVRSELGRIRFWKRN